MLPSGLLQDVDGKLLVLGVHRWTTCSTDFLHTRNVDITICRDHTNERGVVGHCLDPLSWFYGVHRMRSWPPPHSSLVCVSDKGRASIHPHISACFGLICLAVLSRVEILCNISKLYRSFKNGSSMPVSTSNSSPVAIPSSGSISLRPKAHGLTSARKFGESLPIKPL